MNRFKVIYQFLLIIIPLALSLLLSTDFLWSIAALLLPGDTAVLESELSTIIPNNKIISFLIGLFLSIILLTVIRAKNKNKTFNIGSDYFDYPIVYYFLANRLLGYGRVNLVRVPLYLQFKIIFADMFPCIATDDHPLEDDTPKVKKRNMDKNSNEINLILSDTYRIQFDDLPDIKKHMPSIYIERTHGFSGNRTYNPEYISMVRSITNKFRFKYDRVNVFATTNTKHTKEIVLQCFDNGGRTGFKDIYVYEQNSKDYSYDKPHRIL